MIVLFSKLLIAHLLGDFVLFRNKKLKEKGKSFWASKRMFIHSLIHFVLAWMALSTPGFWYFAIIIALSHYVGDIVVRTSLSRRPQFAFATEQLFHLMLIVLLAGYVNDISWTLVQIQFPWVGLTGLVAVTFPSAKFIEVFLAQWPPTKSADKIRGLVNAGLWIGILERVLIYIFIVTGHWEGIGFLLAAKSVFRFGDLTNSKDISLTEYIMVGTLLSFCLAIVIGMIVIQLVP